MLKRSTARPVATGWVSAKAKQAERHRSRDLTTRPQNSLRTSLTGSTRQRAAAERPRTRKGQRRGSICQRNTLEKAWSSSTPLDSSDAAAHTSWVRCAATARKPEGTPEVRARRRAAARAQEIETV